MRIVVALVSVAILSSSCSSAPAFVGVYQSGRGSEDVEVHGELVVEDGCLMLLPEGGEALMLGWPDDWSVTLDGDDLVDGDGKVLASVGDDLSLGGGPTSGSDLSSARGDETIPEDCASRNAFAVASIES
jgi:hypothetical protein